MSKHTWLIHISVTTDLRYTDAEMERMAYEARDALLWASPEEDKTIDAMVADCEEI